MSIRWKASIVIARQKRKFFLRADLELYNPKQLCNIAVLQHFPPDASLQNCELNLYAKNQKLSNSFDWQKWQKKSTIVTCPMSFQRSKKISAKNWPLLCARNLYWYLKKLYCIFAFETDCRSFFCLWASKDHFIAIIFNINSFLKKILFH